MNKIVAYTDYKVASVLKPYISRFIFDKMEKNILVYGKIQSGKTKQIINIMNSEEYKGILKVLVLQNSLLVLKQLSERLNKENIKFTICDKNTKKFTDIVVLINNKSRYEYFEKMKPKKYILLLDESDLVYKNCPLESYKTFHITATPFYNYNIDFDRIISLKENKNYCGIEDLIIKEESDAFKILDSFLKESSGMFLINIFPYFYQMYNLAISISEMYKNVPVVLLTSDKILFLKGQRKCLNKSITEIVDSLYKHTHIIFIANRLSNRGLSYTSSNYERHLTYQFISFSKSIKSIQKLRILGNRKKKEPLRLFVFNNIDIIEKYTKKLKEIQLF